MKREIGVGCPETYLAREHQGPPSRACWEA